MDFRARFEKLAPDVLETLRRFPLATIFLALTTAILLAGINNWITQNQELWGRLAVGLATGAIFAVAGVLFTESRPTDRPLGPILAFALPVLAIVLLQIGDTHWFVPYAMPLMAIFWLSVAAFTRVGRGEARADNENRFWWFNHQAVATAIIAATGFALIGLGIAAIERSVALLFGFESGSLFYMFVLPVVGVFFTPLYWLSTLPRLSAYDEKALIEPDFISRAIGFLGQFILTPLLLAYALILLAYTAQIVILRHMPDGMLGWMVLGFTITGAATWLVLHPPFMRSRGLVRLFRRYWFWLTIIPLILYAIAVYIRIDAYGLTSQRLLLIAGGLWAGALTLIYLTGRGDIRLIPALAGLALTVLSIGPWNVENGPKLAQAARLDHALQAAGSPPAWTPELAAQAESSLTFLANNGGHDQLAAILPRHGIAYSADTTGLEDIRGKLRLPTESPEAAAVTQFTSFRKNASTIDLSATPVLIGKVNVWTGSPTDIADLSLRIEGPDLVISRNGKATVEVNMTAWATKQPKDYLIEPFIDFTLDTIAYRLAIDDATITIAMPPTNARGVQNLTAILFASKIPQAD
jgi:hypothetical protein